MKINRTSRDIIPWNRLQSFLDRNKKVFTYNSSAELVVGVLTNKELDQVVTLGIERSVGGNYFIHGKSLPYLPTYVSEIEIHPSARTALLDIPEKEDWAVFSGYNITLEDPLGDFEILDRQVDVFRRAIEHVIADDDLVLTKLFDEWRRGNKNQF